MTVQDKLCIKPCNMHKFLNGNLYENIVMCIKRAKQIELERFEDITSKLSDWNNYVDNFSNSNVNFAAQEEISLYFENLKKPELMAMEEFEASKIMKIEIQDE